MSTLHIVSKSPFRTDALQRCLALIAPGDSVILIEDGVFAVHQSTLASSLPHPDVACFALTEDLAARSLSAAETRVRTIDYAGFVKLVCDHRNSISHG